MAAEEVSDLIAKEFIAVKLDSDRGIGAKDIGRRFIEKEHGLPWFAFLDFNGNCLIHSIRSNGGNIGHPVKSDEVAYFRTMLLKARKNLTKDDISFLIQSLEAFNKDSGFQTAITQ